MKFNLAVILCGMLFLTACSNEIENVQADTKVETEETSVADNVDNETTENLDEAPEDELITNFKVETLSDIAEYFKLYGYTAEIVSEKYVGQIGAKEGAAIEIDGDVMEIYEFDPSTPESVEKLKEITDSGLLLGNEAISNGNYVIIGFEGYSNPEAIRSIFTSFNGGTDN